MLVYFPLTTQTNTGEDSENLQDVVVCVPVTGLACNRRMSARLCQERHTLRC